jgi:tetratricopeptide (TPR) repeat protein
VGRTGAAAQAMTGQKQLEAFENAMKLFHARSFREARDAFLEAQGGPERDVAQRASLHIRMCERRLEQEETPLQTAEEHYNYGVALINARKLGEAQQHLERALQMEPGSDHVLYALALAHAIAGNLGLAAEHLRRAIEIDPRNRIAARQDADLAPFAGQPPLDALLYPEKRGWQG